MNPVVYALFLFGLSANSLSAIEYPAQTSEPQKSGWPLTAEERAYVVDKPEHARRPGSESNKHLPQYWPAVPSAGHWGGSTWLDAHAKLVDSVRSNSGPIDVLLVGDSITQQWGSPLNNTGFNAAWLRHFSRCKTVNIGIGGDKVQNVLWRIDHGGVEAITPRVVVLMIGNNNMFFSPETGVPAVAHGIQICVQNLREKFPQTPLILVKILPAHAPGNRFYEDIKKTNAALDSLPIEGDPKVRILDLTPDFSNPDGSLKSTLFTPDQIHLSLEGYSVYAKRLSPLLETILGREFVEP